MSTIKKFGQEVTLQVFTPGGELILDTNTSIPLRTDFEVKHIPGMRLAKFSLYNLAPSVLSKVIGLGNLVVLNVSLHGVSQSTQRFTVQNGISYKAVPEGITELYCRGAMFAAFTDKQVAFNVKKPTIERMIEAAGIAADVNLKVEFVDVPDEMRDYIPPKGQMSYSGSGGDLLKQVGHMFNINIYDVGKNTLRVVGKPKEDQVAQSGRNNRAALVLTDSHMLSNPRIGIARCDVRMLLNTSILPGTLLDLSKLVSSETGLTLDQAAIAGGLLPGGGGRYSVLTATHKGSNYTDEWSTSAMGVGSSQGRLVPLGI